MAVRRALFPASWACNGCQTSFLRTFAAISGAPPPPIRRHFTSISSRPSAQLLSDYERESNARRFPPQGTGRLDGETEWTEPQAAPIPLPSETTEYIPWYLQVQPNPPAISADHPLAHKQKIPDLPDDAPPILPALLTHLSLDIGLDFLSLLDLRPLDPPAALGGNLMMIVGTARSEKHLHVSADRFCRHLRSEYALSPYADGLLGRNELKLKMRRKNRRAKLMANVGATSPEHVDDGIRTGWVCVLAGQVGPAQGSARKVEPVEGFVGFGEANDKVTVVVQMFTEEKRRETDLEGLWGTLLERSERKRLHREDEKREAEVLETRLRMPFEAGEGGDLEADPLGRHFAEVDAEEGRAAAG